MRRGLHTATVRREVLAGLVAGLVMACAAERGMAATACGTMITNVATATMTSGFPDFVSYEVSYNATVTVTVLCPPVVRLVKWASTPLCAAGCTVTFQICVENQVADSVWGITITDVLPTNMVFTGLNTSNYDTTQGGPFPAALGGLAWANAATTAGPWTSAAAPTVGQGAVWYMRWVIGGIGPQKSACVTYSARIL